MNDELLFSYIPKPLVCDGKIHRFDTPNSSKGKSGWYVVKSSHKEEFIIFGDWALDNPNKKFVKVLKKFDSNEKKNEEDELIYIYTHIANKKNIEKHNYIVSKHLDVSFLPNVRIIDDKLMVPLHNICTNMIQSFQFISQNGDKLFAKDRPIKMCAYIMGMMYPTPQVFVCEGVATGSTIFYLTARSQTYCMMSYSGLSDEDVLDYFSYVAKSGKMVIFALDNDFLKNNDKTRSNLMYEIRRRGMNYIIPTIEKDFNDVFVKYGKDKALDEFLNINV